MLLGVLDRFVDFQVIVIFSIPFPDRKLKLSEINLFFIQNILTKFYQDLFINWGAS